MSVSLSEAVELACTGRVFMRGQRPCLCCAFRSPGSLCSEEFKMRSHRLFPLHIPTSSHTRGTKALVQYPSLPSAISGWLHDIL